MVPYIVNLAFDMYDFSILAKVVLEVDEGQVAVVAAHVDDPLLLQVLRIVLNWLPLVVFPASGS